MSSKPIAFDGGHRSASAEVVARLARRSIKDNRWPLEVTGCSEGQRHVTLTLSYRGTSFARPILVDTHRTMEYGLWRLFDRDYADMGGEGSVKVTLRKLDEALPCIACEDKVWNCIACNGRNVATIPVELAPTIMHESPPCAGYAATTSAPCTGHPWLLRMCTGTAIAEASPVTLSATSLGKPIADEFIFTHFRKRPITP